MDTTRCPQPGLEPRPLDPEMSALTMRPLRLPIWKEKRITMTTELTRLRVEPGTTASHKSLVTTALGIGQQPEAVILNYTIIVLA